MAETSIEWTWTQLPDGTWVKGYTFNPWWGCVKQSPGCDNCYADDLANRYGHHVWGKDAPRRFFGDKHWAAPLKWNKMAADMGVRLNVFAGSMCDVMEYRPDLHPWRLRMFDLIEATENLNWLLVTKLPQNYSRLLPESWLKNPRHNVWGLTTVENQNYTWRILELLRTPFAVRGISAEPLLGPLDLTRVDILDDIRRRMVGFAVWDAKRNGKDPKRAAREMVAQYPKDIPEDERPVRNVLNGAWFDGWDSGKDDQKIDWVIPGGESGHGARPPHPDWFRTIRDHCAKYGTALFFKQWGEFAPASIQPSDLDIGKTRLIQIDGSVRTADLNDKESTSASLWAIQKVGKGSAGNVLDGVTHKAFPVGARA